MKKPEETKSEILAVIKNLPLLPTCASQLLSTINDPDHNLVDIVNLIEHDAALTANILKLANSSIYGFPQEITSVQKAISLVGEETVVNTTLSDAASNLLDKKLKGYDGSTGELWRHNLITAIASRKIASIAREKTSPALAFTGGIIHDIGKSVLSDFLGRTSSRILNAIDNGKVSEYQDAERRIMGIDHSQVGSQIADHWNLPELLKNIIRFHHDPQSAPHSQKHVIYCVHLGDILAMMAGFGTGADSLCYTLDEKYEEYISLPQDQLSHIILEIQDEFDRTKEIFDK